MDYLLRMAVVLIFHLLWAWSFWCNNRFYCCLSRSWQRPGPRTSCLDSLYVTHQEFLAKKGIRKGAFFMLHTVIPILSDYFLLRTRLRKILIISRYKSTAVRRTALGVQLPAIATAQSKAIYNENSPTAIRSTQRGR